MQADSFTRRYSVRNSSRVLTGMKRCNRLLIRGFPTDPVPQVFAKPLKALSRISEYYAAKLLPIPDITPFFLTIP